MTFKATHMIIANGRRIPVYFVDGVCYTKSEWSSHAAADWEYSDDDGLTFQGERQPGTRLIPLSVEPRAGQ